jgi:hypothetical protein
MLAVAEVHDTLSSVVCITAEIELIEVNNIMNAASRQSWPEVGYIIEAETCFCMFE